MIKGQINENPNPIDYSSICICVLTHKVPNEAIFFFCTVKSLNLSSYVTKKINK